jgi:hypothetical protein
MVSSGKGLEKEFEEFKERIQQPAGRGLEGSRFNAYPEDLNGLSPYDLLRLGNVQAGGSRELPSAML